MNTPGGMRRHNEAQIQRTVFQHLRTRAAPGVFAFPSRMAVIASRSRPRP
jgi:hypothetical protein